MHSSTNVAYAVKLFEAIKKAMEEEYEIETSTQRTIAIVETSSLLISHSVAMIKAACGLSPGESTRLKQGIGSLVREVVERHQS